MSKSCYTSNNLSDIVSVISYNNTLIMVYVKQYFMDKEYLVL